MKRQLLLASIIALAVANVSPAFANAGPKTFPISPVQQGPATTAPKSPHWEWQYGYIGHHARYAPHWVLVRQRPNRPAANNQGTPT
jgi:hypothetical protein